MANRSHHIRLLAIVIGVLLFTSCAKRAQLSIARDATPTNVIFILTDWQGTTPGALRAIRVYRCLEQGTKFPGRGELIWHAATSSESVSPVVGRIEYGGNLGALTNITSPQPLGVGCYIVSAYADFPDPRVAVLVFDILDGRVVGRAEG